MNWEDPAILSILSVQAEATGAERAQAIIDPFAIGCMKMK
jgi:hypothetical protein